MGHNHRTSKRSQYTNLQKLQCHTLLCYLFVAGHFTSPETRIENWVFEQLRFMSRDMGIRNTTLVLDTLNQAEQPDPWAVHTMLGSYAMSAQLTYHGQWPMVKGGLYKKSKCANKESLWHILHRFHYLSNRVSMSRITSLQCSHRSRTACSCVLEKPIVAASCVQRPHFFASRRFQPSRIYNQHCLLRCVDKRSDLRSSYQKVV